MGLKANRFGSALGFNSLNKVIKQLAAIGKLFFHYQDHSLKENDVGVDVLGVDVEYFIPVDCVVCRVVVSLLNFNQNESF